ncbi:hypothetical protein [Nostoc sp. TCL26-01]|uniref:hypothetical protein n=1 Tax=Nostoc sp. TCL26-01 TaxID=2576904 RepID=UPI0015BA95A9|nr:hypothetical protein [Nostoc sp. TCL26-01]
MDFPVFTSIAFHQLVNLTAQQWSQRTSVQSENQMRDGGIFLILLLMSCICLSIYLRRRYEKQRKQQADARRCQRIESLERIWRMNTYQKPEGDSKRR